MSVRVNLLQPQEIKQQNAVNREAMFRLAGMIGGAALAAGFIFLVFQYRSVTRGYSRAQEKFAVLEEDYLRVKKMKEENALNHRYVTEVQGWTDCRIRWTESMFALQTLVPENVQLTRLTVRGEIKYSAAEPGDADKPGTPARLFNVRVEGKAHGELSDQDVIQFVDGIRSDKRLRKWLSSVKLKDLIQGTANDERTFRIDAFSAERLMK